MRGFFRLAAGALVALGLMAGPALADDRPELVVAVNDLPDTLEPADGMGNVHVRIIYSMFDSLIRRDFLANGKGSGSKLVPGLAESWKRIDDKTIEFKLREGVKFHNGDEVTADDVVFTFTHGRMLGDRPIVPTGRQEMNTISHAERVDKYTVRIVSRVPDVMMEQRLAGYASWIVNARDYLTRGYDQVRRSPVGTGPYKIAEFVDGEYIKLVANDDYFGGKPTASNITFRVVPETSARVAGLVSGEFDIIVNVPPDQVPVLEGYDDIEVKQVVLDNTHMLVFYMDAPFMKDKNVRQALSLAIDRALLRKALWNDKNFTPNGHQLPDYEIYLADYPDFEFNPEKARALVEASSYKGEEIVYRLPLNYYLNSLEAAQAMQQMWKDVGLNVKVEPVENWSQVTKAEGTNIRPWSNTHRIPDPSGSFVSQWGRISDVQNNKAFPDRAWKAPEEFNKQQDRLVSSTETADRKDAYRKALDIWTDEVPGTMLYNPLETYAHKKSVNWEPYSLYYMDFRPYNLTFGVGG
ncbi:MULTISPECIES: ABC transporter substrate-binding protein [Thalassobaculum]|uniref:Peptide/nickel transport system substrate-binding protein n=1 Tax=Thalassobaculum litoreum DSM 18839 TaxID=1123362 RepID=A0A8G2BK41_9PROT|nr:MULTISPECIES: ABC transporter substrate-binding protein [Thalassobaculum]SDG15807.1 peptide/nickel transport system substrate-binding protein [Thalassobaculum litoreum DSM 18839]